MRGPCDQRFVDNQKRLDLGFIPGGLIVELIDDPTQEERDRLAHDKHRSRVSTRNRIATQQRKGWCICIWSSPTSITATGAAASEPRDIKLHPTAREIGLVSESVTAAAGVVGGSLRSFTP